MPTTIDILTDTIEKIIGGNKSPTYQGGPFIDYSQGNIASYKHIVIALFSTYLREHKKDLSHDQLQEIQSSMEKLQVSDQYSAVYTHLSILKTKFSSQDKFSRLLDYVRDYPLFAEDLRKHMQINARTEKKPKVAPDRTEFPQIPEPIAGTPKIDTQQAAVFFNPIEGAVFETELAHAVLIAAPKASAEKVNQAIINYCIKFNKELIHTNENALRTQLIKYKVCKATDFKEINAIDKFIELLQRPLSDPRNASELATLHLVFFNFEHVYDPSHDVSNDKKNDLLKEREMIHRKLRPKNESEMFDATTRGRESVFANNRTKEFGITDPEHVPAWAKNWHRNETTPHKYRAALNLDSPVIKTFRSHNIPYIAGPSGTAADCAEGLYFLMPNFTPAERQEYFNLLAAAEVAQGHHSIHEIILPLCNIGYYEPFATKQEQEKNRKYMSRYKDSITRPWVHFDFTNSYEQFLSNEFKSTQQYQKLRDRFPQYLDPQRLQAEHAFTYLHKKQEWQATKVERFIRARRNYSGISKGAAWQFSDLIANQDINLQEFKKLSINNIKRLQNELGTLTADEQTFLKALLRQNVQITHYTKASDAIFSSGMILSNSMLKQILGDGNFNDKSNNDLIKLANGGFVFFRYELNHDSNFGSRFGDEHIIVEGNSSPLFETGWVSLCEMFAPGATSIVKRLTDENVTLREKKGDYEKGKITYKYGNNTYEFDLVGTSFYGPDIQRGIALAAIRELRRIGGDYQKKRLKDVSRKNLDDTLSKLFRIEAKIPSMLHTEKIQYSYTAPILMQAAIKSNDKDKIGKLLAKGMKIDDPIAGGKSAIFYLCTLSELAQKSPANTLDLIRFLQDLGAKLTDDETTTAHVSAIYGNKVCLGYCLDHGIAINALNTKGRTIISYAFEHAQIEIINFLVSRGAVITINDLIMAIKSGHKDIVESVLIQYPEKLKELIAFRDKDGNSVIHLAAKEGHSEIIRFINTNTLFFTTANNDGEHPIHLAVKYAREDVIDILEKAGANFDITDNKGDTPLHLATRDEHVKVLEKLLSMGLNPNIKNLDGNTLLHLATNAGSQTIINVLLKNQNVDPNSVDKAGNNAVHLAVVTANYQLLPLLLERVPLDQENNVAELPSHIAIDKGDENLIRILISGGQTYSKKIKMGSRLFSWQLIKALLYCQCFMA